MPNKDKGGWRSLESVIAANEHQPPNLFSFIQPGQQPNQYDPTFHVPIYYVTPTNYFGGSQAEYNYDPTIPTSARIAMAPEGLNSPVHISPQGLPSGNVLNHELTHHILRDLPAPSNWFETLAANPMLGTQYQGAEGVEALPAALFGGYGVDEYPADVREELRKTALQYANKNYGANTAYDINRLAQTNRLLPEVVKPISPPITKANMKPMSLFQSLFGR